jgi:hypothetical protein
MSSPSIDVEQLLGRALAPIEPPPHLAERLETTLSDIAASSQPSSSSTAWSWIPSSRSRTRVERSAGGSTGASARESS